MWKYILFGSAAVLLCTAMQAHAVLPSDPVDRAIACSAYGGFAPNSDPGTVPAKRVIDHTIKEAVATGRRTQQEVNDTAMQAMKDEPREELIADWNECRDSFAPPDFSRSS